MDWEDGIITRTFCFFSSFYLSISCWLSYPARATIGLLFEQPLSVNRGKLLVEGSPRALPRSPRRPHCHWKSLIDPSQRLNLPYELCFWTYLVVFPSKFLFFGFIDVTPSAAFQDLNRHRIHHTGKLRAHTFMLTRLLHNPVCSIQILYLQVL
jgi:hypothetical protein